LANATFDVRRGEVFGLLGPPGAGKSTMLKILAGKLRPTEGKVEVFGRSPRRGCIKARIGYLAENNTQARRTPTAGIRGLLERLFELVTRAGGGMPDERPQSRQPLAGLLSALINDPDLLLLDEPFDALDTAGSEELKRRMLALARGGKAIVFSSQWLADAVGICDRVAIHRWGTIEAVGTFEELFSEPAAICSLAPVLSPATSKRLVQIICEDLHCGTVPEKLSAGSFATESPDVISNVPLAPVPAPAPAAADEVLTSLVKPSCLAPPAEVPDKTSDTVDHKRLAELTRPGS
jgi:ABC-type Na+ transport system ATPase subunit NatA